MVARTYDEWKHKGYQVKKGEKSRSRNASGVPIFTRQQVKSAEHPDPYAGWDFEGSMEESLGGWDWYK